MPLNLTGAVVTSKPSRRIRFAPAARVGELRGRGLRWRCARRLPAIRCQKPRRLTPMRFFQLSPPWNARGDNPYPWVDSADGLFGRDALSKVGALLGAWVAPTLFASEIAVRLDAYCCPAGYFLFSDTARSVLASAFGASVEWLPVDLAGIGRFSLLHPLRSCPLGPESKVRRNDISGNVVQVDAYDLIVNDVRDANAFLPAQPPGSAAAAAGFCLNTIVTTELPALVWQKSGLKGVRFQPLTIAAHGARERSG